MEAVEFTDEQLKQIEELNVQYCSKNMGFNNDLFWQISKDGKISASLSYKARDVDGDYGHASTTNSNISFKELIETIKNPSSKFNTRSWN